MGYVIFAAVVGFTPLFGFNGSYHFTDPTNLIWFALIGLLGGFIGLLYAKGFYGIASLFERIRLPRWTRPAIGGVLVGCMALVIPEVLGTGYGWIQAGLGHRLLTCRCGSSWCCPSPASWPPGSRSGLGARAASSGRAW